MRFCKEQRVTVPGMDAQGVIVDATETVADYPIYTLRWLDESGETHTGTCGEGDLAEANPSNEEIMDRANAAAAIEKGIERSVAAGVKRELAKRARANRKRTVRSSHPRKRR